MKMIELIKESYSLKIAKEMFTIHLRRCLLVRSFSLCLLVVLVTSCYKPDRFGAEVSIDRPSADDNYNTEKVQNLRKEAVALCFQRKYREAEPVFNSAIDLMERDQTLYDPSLYVDRGRLMLRLDRSKEAIPDLQRAIQSEKLPKEELARALLSLSEAYSRLDNEEMAVEYIDLYSKCFPGPYTWEETEEETIIHNVPDDEVHREVLRYFNVNFGICEKAEDVRFDNSGNCYVKKKKCCGTHEFE